MWKDPIVEEIHAVREQVARECDYDLNQIIARLLFTFADGGAFQGLGC